MVTAIDTLDEHRCKTYGADCLVCLVDFDECRCKRGPLYACAHNLPSTSEHCMRINRATWKPVSDRITAKEQAIDVDYRPV